jgi:hypothetical protein
MHCSSVVLARFLPIDHDIIAAVAGPASDAVFERNESARI